MKWSSLFSYLILRLELKHLYALRDMYCNRGIEANTLLCYAILTSCNPYYRRTPSFIELCQWKESIVKRALKLCGSAFYDTNAIAYWQYLMRMTGIYFARRSWIFTWSKISVISWRTYLNCEKNEWNFDYAKLFHQFPVHWLRQCLQLNTSTFISVSDRRDLQTRDM